ncbi:MAG: SDR family NAD(P)-dependent oxidoreductase, partial [Solirubrobacteraceae bacterium]|nr:SDR family NAD(P)-dependent oxidoreductase [Solirubrobacteraceae bacterium]
MSSLPRSTRGPRRPDLVSGALMSTTFTGRVCAVTGAGSGIGRALALELARRGAKLALSDVNETTLAETGKLAEQLGAEVITDRLDTSDAAAWEAYAKRVLDHYGVVNQIYNNAGIALGRSVKDSTIADYDRVLGINLRGVIAGTVTFLPHLIASGDGYVVNISSLNGIVAQPEMSHYVTAKFGVRGFTESLRMEMQVAGHPVGVSVVHPGGIKTNIANAENEAAKAEGKQHPDGDKRTKLYNEKLLKMPPEQAANIILGGVEKRKMRIIVGNDARAMDLFERIAPT